MDEAIRRGHSPNSFISWCALRWKPFEWLKMHHISLYIDEYETLTPFERAQLFFLLTGGFIDRMIAVTTPGPEHSVWNWPDCVDLYEDTPHDVQNITCAAAQLAVV
jgi:hypothetical protein